MAAPPPVSQETYLKGMTAMRQLVNSWKGAGNAEEVFTKGVQAQEAMVELAERMITSIGSLETKTATLEATAARLTPVTPFLGKPLSESKCVANMKTLGSDKAEFKIWNDKFINAIAQTLGTPWRKFMRNLNRVLDQDRKVLTQDELNVIEGALDIGDGDTASESLYYVLVEKTEGDAALRVNSGEPGQGMQAYMRVYLWFAGTTGLALTEKTRVLMHPTPVKHESEIADALERWSEQERTLRAHGDEYKLNAAFKVTALRVLMTCKREQFEFFERESRTKFNDKITDDMFNDLLARVREYAQQRRLEDIMKKAKGDPMDIGQLHGLHQDYDAQYHGGRQPINEAHHYDAYSENYVDALGKGKGKFGKGTYGKATGKGFNAQCYVCGETGHLSYDCPKSTH